MTYYADAFIRAQTNHPPGRTGAVIRQRQRISHRAFVWHPLTRLQCHADIAGAFACKSWRIIWYNDHHGIAR
jgi:hypothetical protein